MTTTMASASMNPSNPTVPRPIHMATLSRLLPFLFLSVSICSSFSQAGNVRVQVQTPGTGPAVIRGPQYQSHVTLYIHNSDGSKHPSGWSTRQADGAAMDEPFTFSPGVGLIEGWTEGVLQMKEGERSWLYVPSEKGYGAQSMGRPGGEGFYIPANSDLAFDIEILGKEGAKQDL